MLMILALMLCHHDGDGRLLAHALPGLASTAGCRAISATSTSTARRPARCGPTSCFNLAILAIACADATSFFFILAVSNCGYIIFNFLNLNAGWIHRIDNGHVPRPWRAPTCILAVGAIFAFLNAFLMGAGAKVGTWIPKGIVRCGPD